MRYRVCKSFEVESGHMLSKHPGRCRYPHGHSRRIDIVVSSDHLDDNDMVCDFKAIKLAVADLLDRFDHAMALNAGDPFAKELIEGGMAGRVVVFDNEDPTTEVMARRIFEEVTGAIAEGRVLTDADGNAFGFPTGLVLERVRVTETSSSWAEYGA
jgi:6-pyruvoyltetrahydropterin/6-carboxytetrahydropterin synthase